MDRLITRLFAPSGLTPHGFCLLWQPGLIWTDAVADFTTGAAYFAIPIVLAAILRRRPEFVVRPILVLFISFILLCGVTHWLDLLTLWVPVYGIQGAAKALAAGVSILTAIALCRALPELLARPSIAELKQLLENHRQNQDFLDRVGHAAGVGGWEVEIATGRVTWSRETYRIHGLPLDYVPTLDSGFGFFAPQSQPVIRAAAEHATQTGEGWDLELLLDRADGARIWVRSVGSATSAGGTPNRLLGALQDVTAQVTAQRALREMNQRSALAAESAGIGVWDWDIENDKMLWDSWMFRLYGLDPHDGPSTYELWVRHLHPQDREAAVQAVQDDIDGIRPYRMVFRIVWPDGSVHHIRASGLVTRDAAGRPLRMIGTNVDVTEPRQLTVALAAQHELLKVTLHSIADGVITTDPHGRVTWLNPVAETMTGWQNSEAQHRPLAEVFQVVHEDTRAPAADLLSACLDPRHTAAPPAATLLIARADAEYAIEHSAAPMRTEHGETLGMVLVFRDMTEHRRLSREMSHRSSHDQLTGLVNRAEFDTRLNGAMEKARAGHRPFSLLNIDLDQFKLVNDSCGHRVGDQMLIQVARLIAAMAHPADTVARLGGDEFAMLLEDCPAAQAKRLGQCICERLDEFRFIHDDKRFRIGASIGVVPVDDRWITIAALQQAADSACYAAKEAGRNRVHIWSESDEVMRARRGEMQWATRLGAALDEDRFTLFVQRIEPLNAAGPGLHAEVLLRLQTAENGLVLPGAFMPAAERFQLAARIDRWVLRQVIRRMRIAGFRGWFDKLAVNLSGQSVVDRSFHLWAMELLQEAGPEICAKLCLEITETVAITNFADAALFIAQLRTLGVRVALDDFGAGASSFRYLTSMPVDILKIDGQFIHDLLVNPLNEAAVRCFIDVAAIANLKTVAEYVDHPDVLAKLRQMGVDFVQGNLIHRPEPMAAMMDSLEGGIETVTAALAV